MARPTRKRDGGARDGGTLDLFGDWAPRVPAPPEFAPEQVRAASLRAMFSKGISAALKECGKSREDVAAAIGAYLGEPLTKPMLDAYASEGREEHVINVVRYLALVHATGDHRLLNLLLEPFGLIAIERCYLGAIEDAILDDQMEAMAQRQKTARARWKAGRR